ncbi:MAG: amidophosphoribosyltransferase, partial [Pontixanthobacter sp.]
MNYTHPFFDLHGDKLREECGVFGVINSADAATVTALGLHALQHRGQEAAGITSFDGEQFYTVRGTGHVADNFTSKESLAELPGHMAAGHVRYSTTGGAGLRNVQPLYADLASGGFAVAHNGNISNAETLRHDLVRRGAIFQSTSDTEVIIHLVATSRYPTMVDRLVDALRMVEGAYSLVVM